jgi:hypothetical protein
MLGGAREPLSTAGGSRWVGRRPSGFARVRNSKVALLAVEAYLLLPLVGKEGLLV